MNLSSQSRYYFVTKRSKIDLNFSESDSENKKESNATKADSAKEHTEPSLARTRKRRKIKKSRTVMDGKYYGLTRYMNTEDYSSWESYSEDEVIKAQPKKQAGGVGTKKVQKSISSFFTKKQL